MEQAASSADTLLMSDRKLFYRPQDASVDYDRQLGDPGEFPFTRGTRTPRPGSERDGREDAILRELSGQGSAADSNAQFRYLLEHGATGLDVIGDGPTVLYLDPDHPHARHAVGNTGVSLCRAEDYLELYDGVPLDQVSISHSLPSGFAIAGIYLAARGRGYDPAVVRGSTILAPVFGEDTGYGGNLPFELHLRLATDSMEFAAEKMPRFHPFVEDTYFISDGSVGMVEEMALGFVEIREVTRRLVARGVDVDRFAPRIALLVNCGMDFFGEIAKIRASRRYYARIMRDEFGATDPRSTAINVAAHTSGATMTRPQLVNNVVRGAAQTIALYMSGVRAMEISAFDEPIRTPSQEAHIVGLRTQQIVQLETGVADVADPLGGSYYVEALTDEAERAIERRVEEIEAMGSIADLQAQGFFRGLFAEAMVERAGEVDDGSRPVVGVNCHRIDPAEDTLLRDIAEQRIEPSYEIGPKIAAWKETRDPGAVVEALDALERTGRDTGTNVIPAIVAGYEAGATMGEMAGVLRQAYGGPYDPLRGVERPT
jgi:methylmalonyl-CoA mutase N-terminal domain/subunit